MDARDAASDSGEYGHLKVTDVMMVSASCQKYLSRFLLQGHAPFQVVQE
jgi:hypothetical protein